MSAVATGHVFPFQPLGDQVVIRRITATAPMIRGIIVPEVAKEVSQEGEVMAVGPGTRDKRGRRVGLGVEVGDRVLFGLYDGAEIEIEGRGYLIMKEEKILMAWRRESR